MKSVISRGFRSGREYYFFYLGLSTYAAETEEEILRIYRSISDERV